MAVLSNSSRRALKATYVPTEIKDSTAPGRVIEKAAVLNGLKVLPHEFEALRKLATPGDEAGERADAGDPELLAIAQTLGSGYSMATLKQIGARLAPVSFDRIAALAGHLAELREQELASFGARSASASSMDGAALSELLQSTAVGKGLAALDDKKSGERNRRRLLKAVATTVSEMTRRKQTAYASSLATVYRVPLTPVGRIYLERLEMTPAGVEHGELVHSVPLTPGESVNLSQREWSSTTQTFESLSIDALEGFSETGVAEKSDLSKATDVETKHSSSLDVSGSVSASYNGGAYSLTASSSVAYGNKNEQDNSVKDSVAHSMAVTRSASTRTRTEHKISFRVASAVETENLAVQQIVNSDTANAMRVDYYQLMRRWRVDLIRYGLRMTYDITIPNPGRGLIGKLIELDLLNESIIKGDTFSLNPNNIDVATWQELEDQYATSVDAPPTAEIQFAQIATVPEQTYDKWGSATMTFDVPDGYEISAAHFRGFFSLYDYNKHGRHLQVDVFGEPAGTTNYPAGGEFEGADKLLEFDLTAATVVGRTGTVFLVVDYHNVDFGEMQVQVTCTPTTEKINAWRNTVWAQISEAEKNNYEAQVELLRARQASLTAEIAAFDALTLRKMEREEVMRGVLEWLVGPPFSLMPANVQDIITSTVSDQGVLPGGFAFPDPDVLDGAAWRTIVSNGEVIKFVHNAIEWENVIFLAYPYFWDRMENWEFKKFMMHPDPDHREFLRGGAFRVVLPVRPGFEETFAMFMEKGDATADPDLSSPYVSIGAEIRNIAMTNYEGIPPANPDNNVRTLLYPIQLTAWQQIQGIMQALQKYRDDNNDELPAALDDPKLAAAAQALQITLDKVDPWNNPYVYVTPGVYGDYDLSTAGAPAPSAVDGLDAPITSWAEGSVVGRWYEYTPTSAMDLAVTKIPLNTTPLKTAPSPN